MTNKEFFLKKFGEEKKIFGRVFAAIPADHHDYKPDAKSKTAVEIAAAIASEFWGLSEVVKKGTLDLSKEEAPKPKAVTEMADMFDGAAVALETTLAGMTDDQWENGPVTMIFPQGKWEAKVGDMCWGMLFDGIHHRGQISTYLRAMGGKVPSIYGPSADSAPQM